MAKDASDLEKLVQNKKNIDLLQASQRFYQIWQKNTDQAYLEASRLTQIATDKNEQELVLQFLMLLLGKGSVSQKKVVDLQNK